MNARKETQINMKMLVTTKELAQILSIGINNARNVGEQAGAVIHIGKRRLYNLSKIEQYIDSHTEQAQSVE
jgi:hypothetical protein